MTSERSATAMHDRIVALALGHPKRVMLGALLLLVGLGSQLPRVNIDTDPENMLPAEQGARVLHDEVKRDFALYDMLVVGVVDEERPRGRVHRRRRCRGSTS